MAGTSDYRVYASYLDEDRNQHDAARNVTAVDGSGTSVHTITFDGPGLGKDVSGITYYDVVPGPTFAVVLIGNVTNGTGAAWELGDDTDWDDTVNTYSNIQPYDGQRPAASSAKLTGQSLTIAVTYDEPVWYRQLADYTVVLKDGGEAAIVDVSDDAGNAIPPGSKGHASAVHVLALGASLDAGDIEHLRIAALNVTDPAGYTRGGAGGAGNPLLNDTVAVEEGFPPRPLGASITGPAEVTVTFDEPAFALPANYPGVRIWSDYLPFDARNRTVAGVAGSGTPVHVLALDMPDRPIPLPAAGQTATGWVEIYGVADALGNAAGVPQPIFVNITEGRARDGQPHLIAARFTGPNEVTVSYNSSAVVAAGGYAVLADWQSMLDAPPLPDVPNYTHSVYQHNGPRQTVVLNYTAVNATLASGNGTAVHVLNLTGGGVTASATGLINITGLARLDGTPVAGYADALVYDGQLMRVASAWWNAETGTAFVEYGEPARGPLSGYPGAEVRGRDGARSAASEDRGVESVATGRLAVLRDSTLQIGGGLAGDRVFFDRAAALFDGTILGWKATGGDVAGGALLDGMYAANSTAVNGTIVRATLVNGTVSVGTLEGGSAANSARIANATVARADIAGAYLANATIAVNATRTVVADIAGADIAGAFLANATVANGTTVRYYDASGPRPASNSSVRYIDGAHADGPFAPTRITFERPTPGTVISAEPPSLLDARPVRGGYAGNLALLDGSTREVLVEPAAAQIDGFYRTTATASWVVQASLTAPAAA